MNVQPKTIEKDTERTTYQEIPPQISMRYAHLEINGRPYIKITTEISELKPANYFRAILESEAHPVKKKAESL